MAHETELGSSPPGRPGLPDATRYELLRHLGRGGMGVVYEVIDHRTGARVALKTLARRDAERLYRLKREFRAVAGLRHPNLVRFYELSVEHANAWITMEVVEGVDFETWVLGARATEQPSTLRDPTAAPAATATAPLPASGTPVPLEGPLHPERFDRLRAGVVQLARGLGYLHGHGVVHRDIKPSNVVVTPEGRVVLLDFGIAASPTGHEGDVVGTRPYMAPERMRRDTTEASSDCYSVGVMLYRCLTGWHPARPVQPPSRLAPGAPEDLEALCLRLLDPDPLRRPDAAGILRALGEELASPAAPTGLVGREEEISSLLDAAEASRQGLRIAVVEGASGIGKSAVLDALAERVADRWPAAVVLRGRCYEWEVVSHGALDDLVDHLSAYLRGQPPDLGAHLPPPEIAALRRMFPVLERVPWLPASRAGAGAEPREQQRAAVRGLVAILDRIGARRPLVLLLDDLQWADSDTLEVLAETLRSPTRALVVLGCRPPREHSPLADLVGGVDKPIVRLRLGPLSAAAARELVASVAPGLPESVRSELGGEPFLLLEAARFQAVHGDLGGAADARAFLERRLAALAPADREALELVAIAGEPLEGATLSAVVPGAPWAQLHELVRAHVLALAPAPGAPRFVPYHDKLREVTAAGMTRDTVRDLSARLARTLEAATPPGGPDRLALHWRRAGEGGRARPYAILAAEEASRGLAFDRSARFYRMALDLGDSEVEEARRLRVALGQALASAGRGEEAAAAFLAASESLSGVEAARMWGRAGAQLVRCGHVHRGHDLLRKAMPVLGMTYPGPVGLMLRHLVEVRRGTEVPELTPACDVPPETLERLDAAWNIVVSLSRARRFLAPILIRDHLHQAAAAGDPFRAARALASHTGRLAIPGPQRRPTTDALIARCRAIEETLDSPLLRGHIAMAQAMCTHQYGEWQACAEHAAEAIRLFREHGVDISFERAYCEYYRVSALVICGEMAEAAALSDQALREADERGDLFAGSALRTGTPALTGIARDAPREAREAVAWAREVRERSGFFMGEYAEPFALVPIDLYEGQPRRALQRMQEWWAIRAFLYARRLPAMRLGLRDLRIRARIGVGTRRCLGGARRDALRQRREPIPGSRALGDLSLAGIAAAEGSDPLPFLEQAREGFEAHGLGVHQHVATAWIGRRRGDATVEHAAFEWLVAHGVVDPERFARAFAPTFPL